MPGLNADFISVSAVFSFAEGVRKVQLVPIEGSRFGIVPKTQNPPVAIPCRFESGHRHHVAARPCTSPHFSAQNAASVYGLPLLPEKGLARLAYSLASALVYGSLSLTTFFGQGQGHRFLYFCRAEALTGELRFCEAKWEFFKLPSNFSGESPERSASNLPSPAKSLVCSGCSLASAVATSLPTFFGQGRRFFWKRPHGEGPGGGSVPVRPGEGFG